MKKIFLVTTLIVLGLSLVACGDGTNEGSNSTVTVNGAGSSSN